jgi:hypothetical protein
MEDVPNKSGVLDDRDSLDDNDVHESHDDLDVCDVHVCLDECDAHDSLMALMSDVFDDLDDRDAWSFYVSAWNSNVRINLLGVKFPSWGLLIFMMALKSDDCVLAVMSCK